MAPAVGSLGDRAACSDSWCVVLTQPSPSGLESGTYSILEGLQVILMLTMLEKLVRNLKGKTHLSNQTSGPDYCSVCGVRLVGAEGRR